MTASVWRYSHLVLAVFSFLLLILTAVTGIILSFQPVAEKLHPYRIHNFNKITLAQTLPALQKAYPGISELTVDANQFVQIKGSDAKGKNLLAYVDARTGKTLGTPPKKSDFFEWVTTLHRSLFAHETGRLLIGVAAFLLLLIAVSGTILIIQRQRGVKRFFTRIVRDNFAQYYHVVLGRLLLIPIIIIAVSGTYLSLSRFGMVDTKTASPKIDFDAIESIPKKKPADFAIFKNTRLSEVENIEFPFSEDVEDYYTLKLNNREVTVNQITGDILSEVKYPTAVLLTNLSLSLHTGRASALWAIVLAIASGNILFFIYSGFVISWKRMGNRVANKYKANECQYIILTGSENGSTVRFAQTIHNQLIKQGKKSFIASLNQYTVFPRAKQLIAITATYGLGDAPTNASKFASLIEKYQQQQPIHYSVLGFGSRSYPDFCKFAFEVNQILLRQSWATPLIDIHTVNDKSPDEFNLWAEAWSQQADVALDVLHLLNGTKANRFNTLTVTANTATPNTADTFLVRLKPKRKLKITSGDLLAIYPANDHRERLYSIGSIDGEIQLSVRLHPDGLGSGFLNRLKPGEKVNARLVSNEHFHFPQKATVVVMISNGTGIAPFLGMIDQNTQQVTCHLYCGFRDGLSFAKHQYFLEQSAANNKLTKFHTSFSREGQKQYVSDLLLKDADLMANVLNGNGVIMICGSLAMQKDVLNLLDGICQTKLNNSLSFYQSHHQIRTDCY